MLSKLWGKFPHEIDNLPYTEFLEMAAYVKIEDQEAREEAKKQQQKQRQRAPIRPGRRR